MDELKWAVPSSQAVVLRSLCNTPRGWDQEIFILILLLTASGVGSSKPQAAWDGVIFILSWMGYEHIHCFLQGRGPSMHTVSGMAGAFPVSLHSTRDRFAIRKSHFYLCSSTWVFVTLSSAVCPKAEP